jgi:tetratricopeptide (TPR) repeat protein
MRSNKVKCAWILVLACATLTACTTPPPQGTASTWQDKEAVADTPAPPAMPAGAGRAVVSPDALQTFDEANRALKAGRIQDAQRLFRSLVQSTPDLAGPHASLGLIYRNAGQLPEALGEFETAARLNPAKAVLQQQLALTYRQSGQFDAARQAYERSIALDPAYATALLNLGILYDLYLGDAPRALELYIRYLALAPGDAVVGKWVTELKNRKPVLAATLKKDAP